MPITAKTGNITINHHAKTGNITQSTTMQTQTKPQLTTVQKFLVTKGIYIGAAAPKKWLETNVGIVVLRL